PHMFSRKGILIVIIIVFMLANGAFLSISARSKSGFSLLERIAVELIAPLQQAVVTFFQFLDKTWTGYFDLVSVREENRLLSIEVETLRNKVNHLSDAEIANNRLRSLLGFSQVISDKMIPAEVIGKDPAQWFRTIIIDKGIADNIQGGMPVVVPDGIVGQVTGVSSHHAKVLLITDHNSAVDALVQRTRSRGIVQGTGTAMCRFEYILQKADLQEGDIVISSGLDGIFPKGLKLGVITRSVKGQGIFQDVFVEPSVDFARLEEVFVMLSQPLILQDHDDATD
ncbi:MAG: rod shape-determining protein MreC, partial [Pseudomonadota bacterium]